MDYSSSFAISAAGMNAERARVDVATLNLANANTIVRADGAGFQPLRAVIVDSAQSVADFSAQVERALDGGSDTPPAALPLPAVSVESTGAAPRRVYEPNNPYADAQGFVSYAPVDTATEMVTMMSALRSYEANVAAMNMARTLALKALDIGGSSS